jgi:lipopolysaccharide export system permease protein
MGIPVPRDQIIPASTTALLHFIHALLQRRNAVSPVPSHFHIGPFAHSPSVLKTFDRYIIKKFLGTFLLILVLIMAIAVVFDVSEKTEDFATMTATWKEIVVDYYANFILYYSNLFSGLLIFIAVLLFTSKLAGRTEVIATLSSGVSFPRFLRPYFITATFLTILALYMNHEVLPRANRTRLAFEKAHVWSTFTIKDHHLLREIAPGTIAYFESYDAPERTGFRFSLERWEDGALRSKMICDRATYDTLSGKWTLHDWQVRDIAPPAAPHLEGVSPEGLSPAADLTERIRRGQEMDTLIPLRPQDLGQRSETAKALGRVELDAYIAAEKASGGGRVAYYEVEKHQRTSYPFATYVFTLLGVSIASRKVRGGTGVHLALGVIMVLLYVFGMQLTTVAATNANFNPLIAVWIPNMIFSVVGAWIYWKAPK